jgi:hypothetical protein
MISRKIEVLLFSFSGLFARTYLVNKNYKLKLSPQLQLAFALGFANLKPPATNLSE